MIDLFLALLIIFASSCIICVDSTFVTTCPISRRPSTAVSERQVHYRQHYKRGDFLLCSKKVHPEEKNPPSHGFGVVSNSKKNNLQGKLRSVSNKGNTAVGAGSKQLRQAVLTFDRIRKMNGKVTSNDVYIRSPLNSTTTFWFVGKVAFEHDCGSLDDEFYGGVVACLSQKRLILEYSMHHLRPQNLGGKFASTLELWLAPPDSEMDVAQNKVSLQRVMGSASDLPTNFNVAFVGYNPEIYIGDETTQGGLRVQRDEQGHPTKPSFEVNQAV
jgi:hypothetical protein